MKRRYFVTVTEWFIPIEITEVQFRIFIDCNAVELLSEFPCNGSVMAFYRITKNR